MLCLDAALPTDTTGDNNRVVVVVVVVATSWKGRTKGWGESLIQALWGGVRLRCREGMDGEGVM